jgi:hypothetical protein
LVDAIQAGWASDAREWLSLSIVVVADAVPVLTRYAPLAPGGADAVVDERDARARRAHETARSIADLYAADARCDHRLVYRWRDVARIARSSDHDCVLVAGSPAVREAIRAFAVLSGFVHAPVSA